MKAVIYCRVSTIEQASNLSLPTQEEACRTYCAKHGYAVDQVFVDAGESAKTTERPEFLRMLAYCRSRANQVRAVVVYALTRFSRNSADHHTIAGLLRGQGIALRSVTEPIDDTASGKLMEGVLAAFAQFDNDQRSERSRAGMKAAVARGRWVWKPPIGYKPGIRGRSPSMVLDPDRAPLIREAFEHIAHGRLSGDAIAALLKAKGLRGPSGRPLSRSRLYELLRSPAYIGRIESSQGTSVGDFEPVVDVGTFEAVQRRLDAKATPIAAATRHVNHPDFPLRRFVRCASCGRPLTAGWSKGRSGKYGFYRCPGNCVSVRVQQLHDDFLALLDACTPAPGMLRLIRKTVLTVWAREQADGRKSLELAKRHQIAIENRLLKLDDLFIAERIDDATYRPQRDELREQLALARLAVNELELEDIDVEGRLAFAEHALGHMSALWTNAETPTARARIQAAFFPEGLTYGSNSPLGVETRGFIEPRNVLQVFKIDRLIDHGVRIGGAARI